MRTTSNHPVTNGTVNCCVSVFVILQGSFLEILSRTWACTTSTKESTLWSERPPWRWRATGCTSPGTSEYKWLIWNWFLKRETIRIKARVCVCVCVLGAGRRTTGPITRTAQTSTAGSYTTAGRASSTATTPTTSSPISTASSRRSEQPEMHSSTLCCYKSPESVSWHAKWKKKKKKKSGKLKPEEKRGHEDVLTFWCLHFLFKMINVSFFPNCFSEEHQESLLLNLLGEKCTSAM